MRKYLAALALSALAMNIGSAQSSSTCRPSDADGIRFRSFVRTVVSSSDPWMVQARTHLGLKAMDSTRVVFVTDNAICNRAAQGINTAQATPNLVRQLFVVVVGNVYATVDPGHPSGEWWVTVTLDNKYKLMALLLGP